MKVSGAAENKEYIIEDTDTGVAVFDYDNDVLPDIFLVNGGRLSGTQPTPLLCRNLGGLASVPTRMCDFEL